MDSGGWGGHTLSMAHNHEDCLRVLSGPKPTDSAGRRQRTLGQALWPQEEQSEEAAITRLFHAT